LLSPPAYSAQTAIVLDIKGAIDPATSDHVTHGLARAAQDGTGLVILRMDTPGGLDTSMREIIHAIVASPMPVATYVARSGARAASAGTYIAYASHIAALAPGTNIGAATPVSLGLGGESSPPSPTPGSSAPSTPPSPPTMESKVTNDAAAYIRSLAELRGRNADWAERAVRQAASLTAADAKKQRVIDFLATDVDELLEKADDRTVNFGGRETVLHTRGLAIESLAPDWRTRVLRAIADPNVALIFMTLGIYGLIFEFLNPGMYLPGVAGGISLLVGLYALAILPVTFSGLALILLGMALMIAEAFAPSGVLAIGGVVAFISGISLLIEPDREGIAIDWRIVAALAGASLLLSLFVFRLALNSRSRRVLTGTAAMIGVQGEVEDWAMAKGRVLVQGERWNAISTRPLAPGEMVRVAGIDGLTLTVEALDPHKSQTRMSP
jgi:membrane-bound serine protease (ClpP class)